MSKFFYDAPPLTLLFDLLRSDAHISVNKALMFAIGVNEAIIFSELLSRQAYFEDKDQLDEDGYFYNTVCDLQSGTALTDYQQRTAIANLKKLDLIDIRISGIPPKRFFRINPNTITLVNLLAEGKDKANNARKPKYNHNSQETSELIPRKLDTNKNNNKGKAILPDDLPSNPDHELGILTAMSNLLAPKRRWRN